MKGFLKLLALLITFLMLFITASAFSQAGHIMQGVGSVNMSMGGAATAQPLDVSGAIQWNPASLSVYDGKIINFDIGLFSSSPELNSYMSADMMWNGSPVVKGSTVDKRGVSPMPALAYVWGDIDSKHTFGVSAFGISGFGVTFPQETNLPVDGIGNPNPSWNPNASNVISYPQNLGGFGHIESDYLLMQVSFTWAYQITETISIGFQPNFNYAALELAPNPLASPSPTLGYPNSDKASAYGVGAQLGAFYNSPSGFKAGFSYKTKQNFGDFKFKNTYLDNSSADDVNFKMNYPSILSFGLGYTCKTFDFALDYRFVNYKNTEGFEKTGWTQTGSVQGFGWENMNVVSAGIQFKGIKKLPLRFGYTYSTNPIKDELAFFSIPATAVVTNAFQFGAGYEINEKFTVNGVFHYGTSDRKTEGPMLNPMLASSSNPYGAVPGTKVGYEMETNMIMFGIKYTFKKKEVEIEE